MFVKELEEGFQQNNSTTVVMCWKIKIKKINVTEQNSENKHKRTKKLPHTYKRDTNHSNAPSLKQPHTINSLHWSTSLYYTFRSFLYFFMLLYNRHYSPITTRLNSWAQLSGEERRGEEMHGIIKLYSLVFK